MMLPGQEYITVMNLLLEGPTDGVTTYKKLSQEDGINHKLDEYFQLITISKGMLPEQEDNTYDLAVLGDH